jgi:AraC family transcriptional regulator
MVKAHRPEIERALAFIAEQLARPISVAEVARAARLSEFHLHRVFHAAIGESIGRFITRRRLELAALRVAYEPDVPLTTVALESGYSSSSNFSKAFAAYFGCSPTRVREPELELPASIGKIGALYGKPFRPAELYSLPPGASVDETRREASRWEGRVRYEEIAERHLGCLAVPGYDVERIEQGWRELIERARQLGLVRDDVDAWGVAHDSPQVTAPELCRYHAGIPCAADSSLAAPLFHGTMPAGRYAVFLYEGRADGVAAAYRSIYSSWFRQSSLVPADFTPFDHYVSGFPRSGRVEMEMWLRVRGRRAAG